MPIAVYQKLSDDDAAAVAAYQLSLKPVHLSVARTLYKIPLPPDYGPPVTQVEAPAHSDKVACGGYLATFGHCMLCHTAPAGGKPFDIIRAFAGGRELREVARPGVLTVSRNITSDPDHGIGKWSDPQIKQP
jgi:mono/diheme cytochrome c family protein